MLKVAIAGNIASGKSVVEDILREKHYPVIDTDQISHLLTVDENVKKLIVAAFDGYDIMEGFEISRSKLGKIIFCDEILRKKLESILHPLIKNEIEHFFDSKQKEGAKIAFVSVPLLFEAKMECLFDKVIFIFADDKIRLERLMNRNNLTLEQAQNRLNIQISQDEKTSLADYVIYNDKTLEDLRLDVENTLKLL